MNDKALKEQLDTWIRQAYVNGSLDVNNPEPQGSDVCTELVWEAVLKDRERAVKEAKQAIQAHIDKRVNESNKELFKALRGIWSNPPKEYVEQGSNELYWNRTSLLKILDTLEAEWENSNA